MNYLKVFSVIFLSLVASRFIPHPPNFTSLLALSFYVPALLGLRYLPALLISFIITDIFIGMHSSAFFTWGSVIFIGLLSQHFVKTFMVSRSILRPMKTTDGFYRTNRVYRCPVLASFITSLAVCTHQSTKVKSNIDILG